VQTQHRFAMLRSSPAKEFRAVPANYASIIHVDKEKLRTGAGARRGVWRRLNGARLHCLTDRAV